jgi:hypothetical protein
MTPETLQIGGAVTVALGCFKLLEYIISKWIEKSSGEDKNQDISLAVLESKMNLLMTNHLPHIQARLDKLETCNCDEHRAIMIGLAKIEEKLK